MPDFNAGEILLLMVLAVIIFGPEKLPELARKTARVLNYLRGIANDARGQLREQVPELADLDLADLNPRTLGVKLLGAETAQELAETGRGAAHDLSEATRQFTDVRQSAPSAVGQTGGPPDATVDTGPRVVAFDPEAT